MFFLNKPPKWNECKYSAIAVFTFFARGVSFCTEFQSASWQGQREELLADRRVRRQSHLNVVWQSGQRLLQHGCGVSLLPLLGYRDWTHILWFQICLQVKYLSLFVKNYHRIILVSLNCNYSHRLVDKNILLNCLVCKISKLNYLLKMSYTHSLIVVQLGAPDSRIIPLPIETCSHLSHLQIQLYPRKETALLLRVCAFQLPLITCSSCSGD